MLHVLVKLYSDGHCEVFGPEGVAVKIVELPGGTTPEQEIALEEFVDLHLPWCYRQVNWPANLLARGQVAVFRSLGSFVRRWSWAKCLRALHRGLNEKKHQQEEAEK